MNADIALKWNDEDDDEYVAPVVSITNMVGMLL